MAVAVRVRAKVTGHRRRGEQERDLALALALPPGPVTARQIVEAAVTAEVAAYQARAGEASLVRVLTDRALRADLDQGAVRMSDGRMSDGRMSDGRMGDRLPAEPVDVTAAVETALLAFDDGIFKVFVGDREVEGPVELPDGSAVLFLRLVPLAGG
jgi:ribosomal protein L16/L10AE